MDLSSNLLSVEGNMGPCLIAIRPPEVQYSRFVFPSNAQPLIPLLCGLCSRMSMRCINLSPPTTPPTWPPLLLLLRLLLFLSEAEASFNTVETATAAGEVPLGTLCEVLEGLVGLGVGRDAVARSLSFPFGDHHHGS